MKRLLLVSGIALVVVFAAGALPAVNLCDNGDKEEREREITIQEVPEPARVVILREAGEHEILEVEEIVVGSRTLYEAEWRADGNEVEITVTPEGEIVGREVEEPDDDEQGEAED